MTDEEAVKRQSRDYLRTHGTEAAVAALRRRAAQAFDGLQSVLESASAPLASRRPRPGEWSLHEIADHVVETHRCSLEEVRCLLAGRTPSGPVIPASLQSPEPLARPWMPLLAELRRIHDELLAVVDAAAAAPTTARAPFVMVVNVPDGPPLEWQDEVDWKGYIAVLRLHAVDHTRQARAVLATLSP